MTGLWLANLVLVACGGGESSVPTGPSATPVAGEKVIPFEEMSAEQQHTELMTAGEQVYLKSTLACVTCHQADGKGQAGVFPPLVGDSAYKVMGDCATHIGIILWGLRGPLEIDGIKYNGVMTPQESMLNDFQVAAVATYERNSWGNAHGDCLPAQVAAIRAKGQSGN